MSIVLLHFSDIHFSTNKTENPIKSKQESLFGAVRNILTPGDQVGVIYSGDIADWGKEEEYLMASEFIQSLDKNIQLITKSIPSHIVVPGNHDLDHDLIPEEAEFRELILNQASPNVLLSPTKIECCLKPQQKYRNFVDDLGSKIVLKGCKKLVDSYTINIGDSVFCFYLINSAHVSKKIEEYNKLWLSTQVIQGEIEKTVKADAISIAVMHHPYGWYNLENQKEIRILLEKHCDLIFTGHEHTPDQYSRSRHTLEQHLYIEGGVLQDFENPNASSFNIIKINSDQKLFLSQIYAYSDGSYSEVTEPCEHNFVRYRQQVTNGFALKQTWESWLEQLGTDFRHPRKPLSLSDMFVYPDLQKLNINRACRATGIVRDGEVLGYIQEKKHVCISGAEKVGKTCLSKRLFLDLLKAGFLPLLIGSDFEVAKSGKRPFFDRVKESLEKESLKIYENECIPRFWESEPKNRVLIIDNFDEINLNYLAKEEILKYCDEMFNIIIVLTAPGLRFSQILNQREADAVLMSYDHADILESDRETTHLIIRKWLVAGLDRYALSPDEIHTKAVRYGQAIQSLIGQGIVPSLPLYVIMMTQQLDANGTLEGTNGLYGSMYEKIIRDIIVSGSSNQSDFEVKFNYLTEFAFELYSKSIKFMDPASFITWHKLYCDNYNQVLNHEIMLGVLQGIGVIRDDCSDVGFKYRYYYCFFLARYIASHMYEPQMISIIKYMCAKLHITDNANTMVFLCHLNKDPQILNMVLSTLKSDFKDTTGFDFITPKQVLPTEPINIPLELASNLSPHEQHIETCKEFDETVRPHGLEELDQSIEEQMDADTIKIMNEMNSAFQSIRICGQILRNSYAGIKGESQVEIITECFNASLRLIEVAMNIMVEERDDIANKLGKIMRHKFPTLPNEELNKRIRLSIYGWALQICYGYAKHASNSLGLSSLRPSFDKVLTNNKSNPGYRLLDISTRLDYFDEFPESSIYETIEQIKESSLGSAVLRIMVWEHFKLFPSDYRIRHRVCSTLDIKPNEAAFRDPAVLTTTQKTNSM